MRAAVVVLLLLELSAHADPAKLTVGVYAPTVDLGSAQARLAYAQSIAKAVETATGIPTEAQSYASLGALDKDNVDFAIVDGPCFAAKPTGKLVANATVGGATSRAWALYASTGADMQQLKGGKLAFVQSGCNDAGFVDNAMLESEVDASFFAARIGKPDITAAIAEVASYKNAQAVFAPVGSVKGLTKVFDTGAVPAPALVVRSKLADALVDKAVTAITSTGGPLGWTKPSKDTFAAFAARLGKVVKTGVFASPEPVRLDAKDVLIDLPREPAGVSVRHLFVRHATL
jgi:hypothetical protein